MKLVEGLFYSEDHEWIKVEGNIAEVGITDFAQSSLGDIVYVELPEVDEEVEAGETFGVIESVKAASDSYMPITGKIVEVNEDLEDSPELLNEDAFANWILKIEMNDAADVEKLMSAKEYEEFCNKEA